MTERARRLTSSDYMRWAKTASRARFNLATSGVMNYPLAELPIKIEDLELSGDSFYGYEPLQKALAAKHNVPPDCVVAAAGTSLANHLAMAAVLEPGDEVLIEHPTYELLVTLAHYLRANVVRFTRRFEDDFRLDPREIERRISPRTRLIVLTNLHNPTSTYTPDEVLLRVGEMARGVGARVLVDEVYLGAMFERAPRTAFHLGAEFIVTSSLTKVYGLSGLRCGWVIAAPALAARMWRLKDLFDSIPAHSAEILSLVALEHLEVIAAKSRRLLETNKKLLDTFLDARVDLEWSKREFGTVAFPRLKCGSVEVLCRLLKDRYETTIVPGGFFEMPQHFRIGIGGDTTTLAAGLDRLKRGLDELRRE